MLNLPCQSTPLSSKTKSSDIYGVHRFRKQPTRGDTRRWPSDRTATRRGNPSEASHNVHTPTRLPDQLISPIFHFFASTARSKQAQPLRHRCRGASPSQSLQTTAKTRTLSSPQLRRVLLYLLHLLAAPFVLW